MGMESFRVDMFFDKIYSIEEIKEIIASRYNTKTAYYTVFFVKKYKKNEYWVENTLRLYFNSGDDYNYLCMEGCFSNYNINLELTYQIYELLNSNFKPFVKLKDVLNPNKELLSYENYEKNVKNFYKSNYNNFLEKYNLKDVPILPGESFYKYINKNPLFKVK